MRQCLLLDAVDGSSTDTQVPFNSLAACPQEARAQYRHMDTFANNRSATALIRPMRLPSLARSSGPRSLKAASTRTPSSPPESELGRRS